MYQTNIEKMDFSELRKEVQRLHDELTRAIRKYDDLLGNLDDNNFSAQTIRERERMKNEIKNKASATLNFGATQRGSTDPADKSAMGAYDTNKLYYYTTGDAFYYYNDASGSWEEVDNASIYGAFRKTGTGIELKSGVVLRGNTLVNGTMTGGTISGATEINVTKPATVGKCLNVGDEFDYNHNKDIVFFLASEEEEDKESCITAYVENGRSVMILTAGTIYLDADEIKEINGKRVVTASVANPYVVDVQSGIRMPVVFDEV